MSNPQGQTVKWDVLQPRLLQQPPSCFRSNSSTCARMIVKHKSGHITPLPLAPTGHWRLRQGGVLREVLCPAHEELARQLSPTYHSFSFNSYFARHYATLHPHQTNFSGVSQFSALALPTFPMPQRGGRNLLFQGLNQTSTLLWNLSRNSSTLREQGSTIPSFKASMFSAWGSLTAGMTF